MRPRDDEITGNLPLPCEKTAVPGRAPSRAASAAAVPGGARASPGEAGPRYRRTSRGGAPCPGPAGSRRTSRGAAPCPRPAGSRRTSRGAAPCPRPAGSRRTSRPRRLAPARQAPAERAAARRLAPARQAPAGRTAAAEYGPPGRDTAGRMTRAGRTAAAGRAAATERAAAAERAAPWRARAQRPARPDRARDAAPPEPRDSGARRGSGSPGGPAVTPARPEVHLRRWRARDPGRGRPAARPAGQTRPVRPAEVQFQVTLPARAPDGGGPGGTGRPGGADPGPAAAPVREIEPGRTRLAGRADGTGPGREAGQPRGRAGRRNGWRTLLGGGPAGPAVEPDDRIEHERAQDHVIDQRRRKHVPHRGPGHLGITEQDAERGVQGRARGGGRRRDSHVQGGRRVAQPRQPSAAVADEAEHQRVLADRVARGRRDVEGQPGEEAGQHAREGAAGERERHHGEQHEIRAGLAGQGEPVDERELGEQRHRDDGAGNEQPAHVTRPRGWWPAGWRWAWPSP